jgi:hypothetical protein
MDEDGADTPEQLLKFVPKERPRSYAPLVEEAGEAIIARIQKAAELSNEDCDRAMKLAHKLSMQLRTAEDRINQLEAGGRTLPASRGPRAILASNNSERDRGKAHHSEISQRHRTNLASQRP